MHWYVSGSTCIRFVSDSAGISINEYELSKEEKDLILGRKWIEMIRRGVIFFVLEKMAAVLGVSNPEDLCGF
jgi:gallate dioxygenase